MKLAQLEKKLLHYIGKAIADYKMIRHGDKVLLCLSGGKDSYTMVHCLRKLQQRAKAKFSLHVITLDQGQPGWNDEGLQNWLKSHNMSYEVVRQDTYSIVLDKVPEGKTYCSLCSRLRRGIIYTYADQNGFNKVALGHHRDDLIRSLLMSIFYKGEISSMPAKLLSDNKKHVVIRPLVYCQEQDIIDFAQQMEFPIIPCNLCGSQENLMRKKIARLLDEIAKENPKVPSNMLHALQSVKPSQLMDHDLFDFKELDKNRISSDIVLEFIDNSLDEIA